MKKEQVIQISGGRSALWWEQKRQMSGGEMCQIRLGQMSQGRASDTL